MPAWLKASPDMATQGTTGPGGVCGLSAGSSSRRVTGTRFDSCLIAAASPGDAGSSRGPDRFHDRHSRQLSAAGTCWHHQGLCSLGEGPLGSGARYPDRNEAGLSRFYALKLGGDIYARGHAQRHRCRLIPLWWPLWPIRPCGDASPTSGSRFSRPVSKHPKRSASIRKPR